MQITGRIERVKINTDKKMMELVIETELQRPDWAARQQRPDYFTVTIFEREKQNLPTLKVNQVVYCDATLKGRKWTDPESGEVAYFMSLTAQSIIVIKDTASPGFSSSFVI